MDRWDETWHRLREWTNDQGPSERLAAQILASEGFSSLDPSHPLGGKDGGRDAICTKDGKRWVMAVYFPRGQQDFTAIKEKFRIDLRGAASNNADGIAFVTNQELRLAEREKLIAMAGSMAVALYHLERVAMILDKPVMASVRKQFLSIGDDTPALNLGGGGGNAMGAGGGGGGVLGAGAIGGAGGPGGRIQLDGLPGVAPGAGGGGAGAIGDGAIGGEGGGGGERRVAFFRAEDLPESVEVRIGKGGKGGKCDQDGQDGGDTSFGDLLVAAGGKGGRAGGMKARSATPADIEAGLRVPGLYLADCAYRREGLLYLLAAGWSVWRAPALPVDANWPAVVSVSMGTLPLGTILEFSICVLRLSGVEACRVSFILERGDTPGTVLQHWAGPLCFSADSPGTWSIAVMSGNFELAKLSIDIAQSGDAA